MFYCLERHNGRVFFSRRYCFTTVEMLIRETREENNEGTDRRLKDEIEREKYREVYLVREPIRKI